MMLKSLWNALIVGPAIFGVIQVNHTKAIASSLEVAPSMPQSPSPIMELPHVARGETGQTPEQIPEKLHKDSDANVKPRVAILKSRITPISPLGRQFNYPNRQFSAAVKSENLPSQLKGVESFSSHFQYRTEAIKKIATQESKEVGKQQKLGNDHLNGSHNDVTNKLSVKETALSATAWQVHKPALIADNSSTADSLPLTSETDISETANFEGSGSDPDDGMNQVTNVSQLRDVEPGDWAYGALRELVERYGCIAGYPDQTFRGRQAMSRYEFAAGVRACLQQIEKLIAANAANASAKQDLATVQKLNQEFGTELAKLRGRVDLAQLVVKPTKTFNVAFTYVNAYDNELTAGSNRANLRSVLASATQLCLEEFRQASGVKTCQILLMHTA